MTGIDKFIDIFGGSFSAYGQTRKTDEFDDRGKHKTKSFIIKKSKRLTSLPQEDMQNLLLGLVCFHYTTYYVTQVKK